MLFQSFSNLCSNGFRHNAAFAHDSTDNIVAKGNEEEHVPAGTTNGGTNGSNSTAVQFNGQEVIVMTSFKEEQRKFIFSIYFHTFRFTVDALL